MAGDTDEDLLRRLAALSPERREMLKALLDEPPQDAPVHTPAAAAVELTAAERSLLAIWEQVLGISGIGVHDDFFDVGGDSIAAMRVAAKAQKAGLPVTVSDLVTRPTVAQLASSVRAPHAERALTGSPPVTGTSDGSASPRRSPDLPDRRAGAPLTPAQWQVAGMGLLHHRSMGDGIALRVPRAGIRGVRAALHTIVGRHDALRSRLQQSPRGWQLVESAGPDGHAPLVDLSALSGDDAGRHLGRLERHLAGGLGDPDRPLCRSICWLTGRDAGLTLACHRVSVDRESMEILRQEISRCLRAYRDGRPALLAEPRRFSAWALEQAREGDPDEDEAARSGRSYELRASIQREVTLPSSWHPGEAGESLDALEHLAVVALARSRMGEARDARVALAANARTVPELRDAVGCYVRLVDLSLADGPMPVRRAPADALAQPAAIGFTCFFRQPLEPAPDGERWTRPAWAADAPFRSRHPLEIHNEAEPGRWRTVWRFDDAFHRREAVSDQCARFLAEIARMAEGAAPGPGAPHDAFAEADLSSDELDGLFAG